MIDRAKAYIRQKTRRDLRSTGHLLDEVADPTPAQRDRARHKQKRDDNRLAVSTAHETPATEPATAPTTEPATEPTTEPATEPTTEPATAPTTAPAACPRCGATGEAPCTTPSGKATKTHKGRGQ
jgi:hypothetical protein